MVIDVVGSLFDQILSDTRVPPQMARQIARLQLPVLRVALERPDLLLVAPPPGAALRQPHRLAGQRVRGLRQRPGRAFLTGARLVQEIVEGDFDQIDSTRKLAVLEHFIAEQTEGAASSRRRRRARQKETELRLQQRYTQQLQGALAPMPAAGVPARLPAAGLEPGAGARGAARRRRFRPRQALAPRRRELVMSVQPKGSPTLRKKFLMALPPLMKDLNEGMELIGWPESAQKDFFGKLLPAHAESLKGQPLCELDHNMMVKQLEAIFATPVPARRGTVAADPVPDVAPGSSRAASRPKRRSRSAWSPRPRSTGRQSTSSARRGVDIDLGERRQPPVPASPAMVATLDLAAHRPARADRPPANRPSHARRRS